MNASLSADQMQQRLNVTRQIRLGAIPLSPAPNDKVDRERAQQRTQQELLRIQVRQQFELTQQLNRQREHELRQQQAVPKAGPNWSERAQHLSLQQLYGLRHSMPPALLAVALHSKLKQEHPDLPDDAWRDISQALRNNAPLESIVEQARELEQERLQLEQEQAFAREQELSRQDAPEYNRPTPFNSSYAPRR